MVADPRTEPRPTVAAIPSRTTRQRAERNVVHRMLSIRHADGKGIGHPPTSVQVVVRIKRLISEGMDVVAPVDGVDLLKSWEMTQ
ncbi:hypothetical protein N8T08_008619 [Aspergillus melleus]|uniref:Uncharacterized protein n=1 Tax=Aspergillus melleus TaxID=138277 RepID=A0ACC3BDJ6_9EURO|nr:hypothetical protein N8T08_008619 [Aspergillus melleus]